MWALIASLYVGNVMLLLLNLPLVRLWVKVLEIPRDALTAGILVFATLGVYSISGSVTELIVMYVIGVLGFFMRRFDFPVAPVILGVILGPLMEAQFRRTLLVSDGDFGAFLDRPFAVVLFVLAILALVVPVRGLRRAQGARAGRGGLADEPELVRAVGGLHARLAVELAQDVADVHVDRARAEEELLGDVAVRAPDGDQPHDLELAAGQPALAARAAAHRLAERGDLVRRLGGQRAGAELARAAVGAAQALERRLAVAGGGEHDAGAQLDLRALERDVEAAVDLDRARELLGGGVGVAFEQRRLADRVGERGERVRMARCRGDPASAPRRTRARPRGRRGAP